MSRIVYLVFGGAVLSGGAKMVFRHVEALTALGFDAVVRMESPTPPPAWFDHAVPIERAHAPLAASDILVFAEDVPEAMRRMAALPNRKVVFCQNSFAAAAQGFAALPPDVRAAYRTFMACSQGVAGWLARYMDYDTISVVPAFADERLFTPGEKSAVIACIPRKRPIEAAAIRQMFVRLYRGPTDWRWEILRDRSEAEVAAALGAAAVFLSLARLEGMSLTTIEAMACECLVAGFTGIGARDYATPINGFWVEEDDCEAAAHALVRAVETAESNAGAAALMRHAGRETAAAWSHAAFVSALASFWGDRIGVAPKA